MSDLLLFLHVLAAFWYVMGLAAVQLAYVRAVRDNQAEAYALNEAAHYQGVLLVPGAIAIGFTGVFLWADAGYNLLTTGWLVALEALYLVTLLVCLPIIGIGLRRARLTALVAERNRRRTLPQESTGSAPGEEVPGSEPAADAAPLLFGGLATLLLVAMMALSVFRPF
ncbi:MAG: DUF2269 family protein [Chloroflexi bacterium]|nr:MAG: DUF2269 family protein [Chloroflexota bacterium]